MYIFSLGFSGSDIPRALWIGLCCSLLASRRIPAWRMSVVAFALDRMWPFWAMSIAGWEQDVVVSAVFGTFQSVPQDLAYYAVRFLGLAGLVHLGFNLRRFLHLAASNEGGGKKGYFPY